MTRLKPVVAGAVCLGLCGFAAWRVRPFLNSQRNSEFVAERDATVRVIDGSITPEFDMAILSVDSELIHERLGRKAVALLQELPSDLRPTAPDARKIAEAYADFVVLNRSGSRQDALASYMSKGLSPHALLTQQDADRADKAWAYSTAWARHAPIDPEAVTVAPLYLRGKRITPPRRDGSPAYERRLSNNASMILEENHPFTAYEFASRHLVSNIDGKSEFEIIMYITIVNDKGREVWNVAMTTHSRVEHSQIVSLPLP